MSVTPLESRLQQLDRAKQLFADLDHALEDDALKAAHAVSRWQRCADVAVFTTQQTFLAKIAFNLGVEAMDQEDGDEDMFQDPDEEPESAQWFRRAILMTQDVLCTHPSYEGRKKWEKFLERVGRALAETYLRRKKWVRLQSAADFLKEDTFRKRYMLLLAAIHQSPEDVPERLESVLPQQAKSTIWGTADLDHFKLTLSALSEQDPAWTQLAFNKVLDKPKNLGRHVADEIYYLRLHSELQRKQFKLALDTLKNFTSFKNVSKGEDADVLTSVYEKVVHLIDLSLHELRRRAGGDQDRKEFVVWGEAVTFFCKGQKDETAFKRFGVMLMEAYIHLKMFDKAERFLEVYNIAEEDLDYLEVRLRLESRRNNRSEVKRLVREFLASKEDKRAITLKGLVLRIFADYDAPVNQIMDLLQDLLPTVMKSDSEAGATILQLLIRLGSEKWLYLSSAEKAASAQPLYDIANYMETARKELVLDTQVKRYFFQTAFQLAVLTESNHARYRLLKISSKFVEYDELHFKLKGKNMELAAALAVATKSPVLPDELQVDISETLRSTEHLVGRLRRFNSGGNSGEVRHFKRLLFLFRVRLELACGTKVAKLIELLEKEGEDKDLNADAFMAVYASLKDLSETEAVTTLKMQALKYAIHKQITMDTHEGSDGTVGLFALLLGLMLSSNAQLSETEEVADEFALHLKRMKPSEEHQVVVFKALASLWNKGLELSLGRKKREGERLKKAARKLAPFAENYQHFFESALEGTAKKN